MSFTRTLRVMGCATAAGALLFGTASPALADQIRDSQWALKEMEADKAWTVSTGEGITVALIDNGVNESHPDLQGSVLPGKNFSTGDPADRESKNDHGTAMATIIAGHGHGPNNAQGVKGLAPSARILPIKHNDSDGSYADNSFAAPLRYAVDHNASIVNMSFIGYGIDEEEKQAIAYAVQRDVLLVASSGNNGTGTILYPAGASGVLAVGAVGMTDKVWEGSNYGSHLLLTAPGEKLAVGGVTERYVGSKGTSDAAAYVSGAAALLRAKFPDLTAGQIANRLTQTAVIPEGEAQDGVPDIHYGYGVIRPYEALTKDIPAGPKNGPLKTPEAASSPSDAVPPNGTDTSASDSSDDNKSKVLGFVGFGATVLVVAAVVIAVVVRRKNRRNGPPPGGPGGYGGGPGGAPGYPPQAYPYQQQSPPPGAYPPGPPQPPYGG